MQVTEREAAALVALGDTYLATRDGEPFKQLEPGDPLDLPLVTGLRPEAVADDREGAHAHDPARHRPRRGVRARRRSRKRAPLEEVHVEADGALLARRRPERDAARPRGAALPAQARAGGARRRRARRRGAKADAIMLDNDARPERVVVRMR